MSAIAATFPEVAALNCDNLEDIQKTGSGQPSTVVAWTGNNWNTLRFGSVVF
jgi:tRNA A37 threonylcarbamoyladenosine synthetase subunit TsaC/SUA5/YrdC